MITTTAFVCKCGAIIGCSNHIKDGESQYLCKTCLIECQLKGDFKARKTLVLCEVCQDEEDCYED